MGLSLLINVFFREELSSLIWRCQLSPAWPFNWTTVAVTRPAGCLGIIYGFICKIVKLTQQSSVCFDYSSKYLICYWTANSGMQRPNSFRIIHPSHQKLIFCIINDVCGQYGDITMDITVVIIIWYLAYLGSLTQQISRGASWVDNKRFIVLKQELSLSSELPLIIIRNGW